MSLSLKPLHVFAILASLPLAGAALSQPFTYTYFPSDATINTPVTTDFAIVGYSGGQYNEMTFAREFTGPSSPTVTIAEGTEIPDAEIFNASIVNVTGGAVSFVAHDASLVNIHGGMTFFALSEENAVVNMYAGQASDLEGQGRQINVYGGTIGTLVANTNSSFNGDSLGSCTVDVFGGTFEAGNDLTAFNDGIMNLRGGLIQSDFIRAAEGGTLNIFGTNLAAQLINPNAVNGYSIYTLSGQLADGNSIDGLELRVRNDGVTYGHSTFNLIAVPTPGAVGVLAMGGLLASRRRR
ncbi:MAG: hypothetical protein WC718_03895 [Phycisphaerales bacterium]|jgi:hypothetical protein